MHQERKFNFSVIRDPPLQVLELKYHGGISMFIMLPENDLSQVSCYCHFHYWGIRKFLGYYCVFMHQLYNSGL